MKCEHVLFIGKEMRERERERERVEGIEIMKYCGKIIGKRSRKNEIIWKCIEKKKTKGQFSN